MSYTSLITLRLPTLLVDRADALLAELADSEEAVLLGRPSRSVVLRLAVLRGLEQLERQVQEAGGKSLAKSLASAAKPFGPCGTRLERAAAPRASKEVVRGRRAVPGQLVLRRQGRELHAGPARALGPANSRAGLRFLAINPTADRAVGQGFVTGFTERKVRFFTWREPDRGVVLCRPFGRQHGRFQRT